jgi:methyl-accepting chemotaxis protein
MGKNTNTYRPKMKSNYKNKKLLKKIMNNSTLEENIKILIGGNIVEPSELDKALFGYKEKIDTTGPIDKLYDNAKNKVEYITNSFGNFVNIVEGLMARKMISVIGMEEKKPEEVAEILKNDSEKLREISEFLETDKGKEMLDEITNLSKKATNVVGESIEQIPTKLDDSMNKMAHAGLKITKGLGGEIPILGQIIAASDAIKGTQDAFNATTNAIENVANLTSDTAEKLKTPLDDIKEKMEDISDEVKNTQDIPITQQFSQTQDLPTHQLSQTQDLPTQQLSQTQDLPTIQQFSQKRQLQKNDDNNIQYGGSDMNKFHNLLQNGGKKLRKRINNTRHAFKNISKNITKKNK